MTVEPLRCIVCEREVCSPGEWVHADPSAPLYGLHSGCVGEGRITIVAVGSPVMEKTLEQRVEVLEKLIGMMK